MGLYIHAFLFWNKISKNMEAKIDMNLKCKVCNGELTKWRKKKCVECDPFWDKASDIINDKDRVEVIFDTANKENNLVGFAKAIKVD